MFWVSTFHWDPDFVPSLFMLAYFPELLGQPWVLTCFVSQCIKPLFGPKSVIDFGLLAQCQCTKDPVCLHFFFRGLLVGLPTQFWATHLIKQTFNKSWLWLKHTCQMAGVPLPQNVGQFHKRIVVNEQIMFQNAIHRQSIWFDFV